MSIICIIPARGGSTRIPLKNIRSFFGKPIIAYAIEAAQKSDLFNHIVVSTDDREIAEIAAKYGAEICIRPSELGKNEVGTWSVTRHAARDYINDEDEGLDKVCCIYATNPMINVSDIGNAEQELHSHIDHVISVGYPGLGDASHFYWSTIHAVTADIGYFARDATTVCYKVDANRICDINTEDDWKRAEDMYAKLKGITK